MTRTHKIKSTWELVGGNEVVAAEVTITADGENNHDIPLEASQANKQVALVIDVSELKSFFMKTTTDVLLETNNSSSPVDTIELAAGESIHWYEGCPFACPFGTDVTAIYLTNQDAEAGDVAIRILRDSTP